MYIHHHSLVKKNHLCTATSPIWSWPVDARPGIKLNYELWTPCESLLDWRLHEWDSCLCKSSRQTWCLVLNNFTSYCCWKVVKNNVSCKSVCILGLLFFCFHNLPDPHMQTYARGVGLRAWRATSSANIFFNLFCLTHPTNQPLIKTNIWTHEHKDTNTYTCVV